MSMFCYQCEQTAQGTGCTAHGVCGKDPETATMQDLLLHVTKGISMYAHKAIQHGRRDQSIDRFVVEALFTTVTNVNFDAPRIAQTVHKAAEVRDQARDVCKQAANCKTQCNHMTGPAVFEVAREFDDMIRQGESVSIEERTQRLGDDVTGLQELLMYGLKGMAAYMDHAHILGQEDDDLYGFVHEALDFLAGEPADTDELLDMILRCGEANLKVMEMLDNAHTSTYGHPEPTEVRIDPVPGKAILVSGHDMKDLAALLEQTEGTGINVYTHGEMLPAHGYPELKKYSHLVGNYGGAWQDQRKEFDEFPGAILMTTNCIQKPKDSYAGRLFTCGLVGWPDITHINNRDFGPVIQAAREAEGFTAEGNGDKILVGFGHNAVMSVADKVIDAVKNGDIRHFFLIGGCDGAKTGRNYYTDFAQQVPGDCAILTLACGKYRINKLEYGDIGGIPRLLDVGQCNDAYSAIKIAQGLADAFGCGVNDLPLSMILSWYEQKAVCILLTLLYLGVQDMRLGPSLPAFITPDVLNILVDKFNIKPIKTPEEDLAAILQN